jgi:hypothetical protein
VTVSFVPDVAGGVLVDAAADLWAVLTADGLTVIALVLDLEIGPYQRQQGRWMRQGIGPQTDGQIQLWARTVAAYPDALISLTSDSSDPFFFTVFDLDHRKPPRPSGTAYLEILDVCAELGVDTEGATISVSDGL